MALMLKKIFPLMLFLVALTALSAAAQDSGQTFVGKIEEVGIKTSMTPMGGTAKIMVIKLDSNIKLDFLLTPEDAHKFGMIDTDRPSTVITHGKIRGVGWKVRLTCDKKTSFGGPPLYVVTNLEKLDEK